MKIYIDENMPPQLADGLAILEKPNNEGVEVYSIQKEYGRVFRMKTGFRKWVRLTVLSSLRTRKCSELSPNSAY